jgi:hypothetical protein
MSRKSAEYTPDRNTAQGVKHCVRAGVSERSPGHGGVGTRAAVVYKAALARFVVVATGSGGLLLAPALLFASNEVPSTSQLAVSQP